MANYAEYFTSRDADNPKPKYNYGNRVFGHWNKIPFIGSVVREEDKQVLVHTDLPVRFEEVNYSILCISRNHVTLLKEF